MNRLLFVVIVILTLLGMAKDTPAGEPENELEIAELLNDEFGAVASVDKYGNINWVEFSPRDVAKDKVAELIEHLSRIKFLRAVVISKCSVDGEMLEKLGKHPVLECLHLRECSFRDDDLESLKELSTLTELDLSNSPITDAGLVYLKPLTKLKFLRLDHTEVTGSGFHNLESLPLQLLFLPSTRVSDDSMKSIGKIHSLEVLNLHDTPVSEAGLKHVTGLYLLVKLVTDANVDEEFLEKHANARAEALDKGFVPRKHKQLRIVKLKKSETSVKLPQKAIGNDQPARNDIKGKKVFNELENAPPLAKQLYEEYGVLCFLDNDRNLSGAIFNQLESEDADIGKVVALLSRAQDLQMVSLDYSRLDKELLNQLSVLPKLQSLNLYGCNIRNEDLEILNDFPVLMELKLNQTPITDDGLKHLNRLEKLELLYLNHTKITGSGLKELNSLPKLRNLYLSNTPITDESLLGLAPLHSLRVLNLSGTPVSDKGIQSLTGLYRLVNLSVVETRVTEEGKQAFLKANGMARAEAHRKNLLPKNYHKLAVIRQ